MLMGTQSGGSPKLLAKYIASQPNQPYTPVVDNGMNQPVAPTQPSIIPDPVVYEGETAQALQAYQNALSAIAARRANTLQNYGMTAHVDANGNLTNYGIDPNNQYGAIQSLLSNEGSQLQALQHNAMDRGIGLKGLGAQPINQARFQGGAAQQQLGQQFVGEIGQEASDQYGATNAYNAAKLQAQRDAIVSAIQNGYFTPAPQASAGTQPPPGAASKTTLTGAKPTTVANKPKATTPSRYLPGRMVGV